MNGPDPFQRRESIRARALELGFDGCRFTTANPPERLGAFQEWLGEGRNGAMGYLERNLEKRADPTRILPGARSIVLLAISYHDPAQPPPSPGVGVVARYARHQDYHDILKRPLQELSRWMDELQPESPRSLWYVDTGPILERDLAERAGLGFTGKHTNLIHRGLGNWFFIAEILTTLELPPDASEPNRCGSCTRCLNACPTEAITAPFKLDARRCISYLTIELKGSIPLDLRPKLGNRIYGCDDCLEVCPWNRFAREGKLMKNARRPDLSQSTLLDLLRLDDAGFKTQFGETPMARTKRRGLLRNVCVALGNTGDSTAKPGLSKASQDKEELVREHATWAINRIEEREKAISPEP